MEINYLAVLVCGIASMIVGFIWYGPLFGKAYMQVMGADTMTPEQKAAMKKNMGEMYFIQFILSLITAWVLSLFINSCAPLTSTFLETQYPSTFLCHPTNSAAWAAILIWFGFVMTTEAGAALWSGKSAKMAWKQFFITAGSQLVTFVVFALILGMWK